MKRSIIILLLSVSLLGCGDVKWFPDNGTTASLSIPATTSTATVGTAYAHRYGRNRALHLVGHQQLTPRRIDPKFIRSH